MAKGFFVTRGIWTIAAASTLASAAIVAAVLPPRAALVPVTSAPRAHPTIAGAFHVHTTRSDGRGSIDEVAAAAHRAGLRFVILTDHGDGTAIPEAPSYRSSVLCIDGVEISTTGGHYAVVGMRQAPYPLAGDARDVVEDVRRLGGYGVVAHGDSPRRELRWNDWDAPIDGLEWLNLDNVWRAADFPHVARALVGYWLRSPEELASLAERPEPMLGRWDSLNRTRPVMGLAATDAHGQVLPSYEAAFRTLSTHVEIGDTPLTGDASHDARLIVDALKAGRHYSAIDALAGPPEFEFSSRPGMRADQPGDTVLEARVAAPPAARLILFRDGIKWRETREDHLLLETAEPAIYRVEVQLPGASRDSPLPWIVSQPIAIGPRSSSGSKPETQMHPIVDASDLLTDSRATTWTVEHDRSSSAAIRRGATGALEFQFDLGAGRPFAQFAALVRPVNGEIATYDRVSFRAHADKPMRVALQLRASGRDNPPRWQRSVYLDPTPRDVSVRFADATPVVGLHASAGGPLPAASIGALMFVVDTNHTKPGARGRITFTDVAWVR